MIKKAAVINDISGFGKCSLTAAIPILSVMGVQPCPMPTAVLTNQSGYDNHYCVDMTDELMHYKEMWTKNGEHFDGIYSGYIPNKKQVAIIADFIKTFRKSDTVVLVDPVMGDAGKMYKAYDSETCIEVCTLANTADIITPNLTEFCIMTDTDYNMLTAMSESDDIFNFIEQKAAPLLNMEGKSVIVTGIQRPDGIYNCLIKRNGIYPSKTVRYGESFSGTGDIFASIICASVINGTEISKAVDMAAKFIEESIMDTVKEKYNRNDGINFEKFLYKLHSKEVCL